MDTITDQVKQARDELEAIAPSTPTVQRNFRLIGTDGQFHDYQCIQEQLGFMPVQEFVTLFSETIEGFAQGDMGQRIAELFVNTDVQMPSTINADTVEQTINDNMPLVQAFFKLVKIAPGLQLDVICMSLGIDPGIRKWFKEAISRPPSQGGLTVDEGFDLLGVFVTQNARLIRRFFEEKGAEFVALVRREVLGEQEPVEGTTTDQPTTELDSPGSTPSSTSSPGTLVSVS